MNAKSLARLLVLVVALAGALGVLSGKVPFLVAGLFVIIANGAAVAWLKWHEEQHPVNHH